ncbi:tRNA dihydrouridine(20/20a) synthase DusA [Solimonas marina]|uniref:tRNA-dihydrouridine(20/20a) synthase n=1 Tax=Solimonas marina TaxID=2714601 RepID=A0A969WC87_9GAMM|nr:tRNA dihydrouridine(20/20a) synthase DusA [Solimonas marina]NKF24282.1 tRNA dihydrouridine(20/20a) synthase DusA [Solimonas marina]
MSTNSVIPEPSSPWRFCVAPMIDWTDRHCRYFMRQLSAHVRLYTEMITTGAILHGDRDRHLRFDAAEHPVALQLGGSDPAALAACAEIGQQYGYDEINLNCGCPSDRVQGGGFGACLMREPALVADAVRAMRGATSLPVTVKHRIGIDDSDEYDFMRRFVDTVANAGCEVFIVHARKAWLQGLSPKENREIPPLRYEAVQRLKQEFPQLSIVINGGLRSHEVCAEQLQHLDGVMVGREAYENPYFLAEVDARLFGTTTPAMTRDAVLERMTQYAAHQLEHGVAVKHITRHILGLYRGQPGGRAFRRLLSERASRPDSDADLLRAAREAMDALPSAAAA